MSRASFEHIAIVGAGAWGVALANAIVRAGRTVTLCTRDATSASRSRTAARARICPAPDSTSTCACGGKRGAGRHDAVLLAVLAASARRGGDDRAHAGRGHAGHRLRQGHRARHPQFMTEVIAESAPAAVPRSSPAQLPDVARGLPTAVTLAARGGAAARSRARSARPRSGPITPPTCAASRSAARPRTCWRSLPASCPAGARRQCGRGADHARIAELFRSAVPTARPRP